MPRERRKPRARFSFPPFSKKKKKRYWSARSRNVCFGRGRVRGGPGNEKLATAAGHLHARVPCCSFTVWARVKDATGGEEKHIRRASPPPPPPFFVCFALLARWRRHRCLPHRGEASASAPRRARAREREAWTRERRSVPLRTRRPLFCPIAFFHQTKKEKAAAGPS